MNARSSVEVSCSSKIPSRNSIKCLLVKYCSISGLNVPHLSSFGISKKRYGKETEPICYHCGTPNLSAELEATSDPDLNSQYKHVFPVCAACGATPYTNRKVSAGKRKRAASSAKVQKRARQGE